MFADDFKRTCNITIKPLSVTFGYTCPNVTQAVRLHSLLQPKKAFQPIGSSQFWGLPMFFFFFPDIPINHDGGRIKRQSKNCGQSPVSLIFFFFLFFFNHYLFLLSLCQIPFGASTSTAARKNPVKTPCCHYCNHSYQSSRPLAAEAAGRWAGTPSSVGCWSGGAWSQAG